MDVSWKREKWSTGAIVRTIAISEQPDWTAFDHIAGELAHELSARWIERVDGPDERWWDLAKGDGKITLHLHHAVGIVAYAASDAVSSCAADDLLDAAFRVLAEFDLTKG